MREIAFKTVCRRGNIRIVYVMKHILGRMVDGAVGAYNISFGFIVRPERLNLLSVSDFPGMKVAPKRLFSRVGSDVTERGRA